MAQLPSPETRHYVIIRIVIFVRLFRQAGVRHGEEQVFGLPSSDLSSDGQMGGGGGAGGRITAAE